MSLASAVHACLQVPWVETATPLQDLTRRAAGLHMVSTWRDEVCEIQGLGLSN